jgi:hypothetical protein
LPLDDGPAAPLSACGPAEGLSLVFEDPVASAAAGDVAWADDGAFV